MDGGTTMTNAKYIGRVGALAVALGVGNVRRAATRMTVSIGVAALVVTATAVPAPVSTVSSAVKLSADSTALLVCGDACPTWHEPDVEIIMNQFITPTHPGQTITPVAVTTPSEAWPITGLLRLIGVAFGDPRVFGPGGSVWPDEPWWKLSGLFDLLTDQSVQAGVADLEAAMAAHGNDHLVIFGESAGAFTVNKEKRKLAAQYPPGTTAPDIEFVLLGDPNVPNGGLNGRFPGLPTVILGTFDSPEPTDTQFHTDVIISQYDGAADFPLYVLNPIADLNAVMGFLYVHTNGFDVSLAPDPSSSAPIKTKYGDTTYYFFETQDLPLFAPLRQLGVPEALIDVVEPFFRVLVELGYDRTISPGEPTPARLIPSLNPATVATDLVSAIGEGINNAAALVGLPQLPSSPAPVTLTAPATESAKADMSPQVTSSNTPTKTAQAMSAELATGNEQMSTDTALSKDATETVESDGASTGPTPSSARELSASDATPKAAKPTVPKATPRPVVRDSLGVGDQLRDLAHRGNGGRPTAQTGAAGGGAATDASSSVESSPAASSSTDSDSTDGDADDS
jgi:hypothetical protein